MARLAVMLLTAVVLLVPTAPRAQEKGGEKPTDASGGGGAAPAGTWKILMPFLGDDGGQPRWLVRLEQKDGKWTGEVLAVAERWPKTTLEKLTVAGGQLRFHLRTTGLTLECAVKVPREGAATRMYGTALLRKQPTPMEMERTELTSLDSFEQMRDQLGRQPLGHEATQLALRLLSQSEARKARPAEARAWAEKAVRSAELYGPAWQRHMLLVVAQILAEEKGFEKIALTYAQRAERLLEDRETPVAQKKVLDVLAAVLEKAGREKEAKEVQARLAKLDFRIRPRAFPGRKNRSNRAVLVELFTGAQCPPCVAADLAFDALAKTYKPSEVILLQYHLHIPGPDPLTSPDSEARATFYGEETVRGTPTILFNGRPAAGGGGDRNDALEKYEEYLDVLNPLLETTPKASLKLSAERKDGKIAVTAEVGDLAITGEDVRLRLALVEEEVSYKGSNGLPVHHHVVRAMPGGPDGVVLKEKTFKRTFTIDVEDVRKKLREYLDRYADKRPFPNKDRPLELKKLKVVGYVQNDRGGEVLQAAEVDVPEEAGR